MLSSLSFDKLARACARRPWVIIGLWAAGLGVALWLVATLLGAALTTDASFTNEPESERGRGLLESGGFKSEAEGLGGSEVVIVRSETLTVDDGAYEAFVVDLYGRLAALDEATFRNGVHYYIAGLAAPTLVSADRRTTIVPFGMHRLDGDIASVIEIVDDADAAPGFSVGVTGDATFSHDFTEISREDLEVEFKIGVPSALIVLVLVFGTLVASVVPVIVAMVSIAIALGVTALLGQVWTFSFFVTNMIAMMGLAVGVDYSLFVVSRFREERARGLSKADAIAKAASTAGRAVFFSGMTVVFALTGLVIVPISIMMSLGGGAIIVVVVSVLAALTLLPAVLSVLGDRVNRLRIPVPWRRPRLTGRAGGFWDWATRGVMRRPVVSLVVVVGLLLAAAIPAFDLKTGQNGISTFPDDTRSKRGFAILDRDFSFGVATSPTSIVVDGDIASGPVRDAIQRLDGILKADGAFAPLAEKVNDSGDIALLETRLEGDPNSDEVVAAVRRLRAEYVPSAFDGVDADVFVTGPVAFNIDYFDISTGYIPVVFAFVLALSFVLLTVVFHSLVVPTKAILMNLLSAGAAYGLIVLVFQKGVGASLLGFQQVEVVDAWIPLFLFSVLFGLSMDYHVLLLSRIREHYDSTGDNTESVAFGLRTTAGLITGAALIMVAVFTGFAAGQLVMFQQVGFGLTVAIFLDATIVRSVLVPAAMQLLGARNWYLPGFLGWLPTLRVERDEGVTPPTSGASVSPGAIAPGGSH